MHAHANDSIPVIIKGKLQSPWNDETSGLAASSVNKGLLYIHNDSGDTSRFFVINPKGQLKAVYYFKGDTSISHGVVDCEDMATGPGPLPGKHYIYLADIGDNRTTVPVRPSVTIYRMQEPVLAPSKELFTGEVLAEPLHFKYPDGARDAETIMIDPLEKLLYIVSKREDSVGVYTTPLNHRAGDTAVLTKMTSLFFAGFGFLKQITAGCISGDGSQVILKNYTGVYYWKRKGKEPLWKLMMGKPEKRPYVLETQGEAIGFNQDGTGYYTVSEEPDQPIYYYPLK